MYYLWGLITGASVTFLIIQHFFNISRKHPYKWDCDQEGCLFGVSTNSDDPDLLMRIIDNHKELHDG